MSVFNLPVSDFDLAIWLADQLAWLRAGENTVDIDVAVSQQTEDFVTSFSDHYAVVCPPYYYGVSGQTTVILIGPCQDLVMAASIVRGYTPIVNAPPRRLENDWSYAAAQYIVGQARLHHMPAPRQLILGGYSSGGMVAQALYEAYAIATPDNLPTLVTFGSPREAGQAMRDVIGNGPVCRWMDNDDPVPLIPPRIEDGNAWAVAAGPVQMLINGQFTHCAGGVSIDANGICTPSERPLSATLGATLSLSAFIMGQLTVGHAAHSLAEYRRRLALAKFNLGTRPQPDIRREPPELQANVRRQELTRIEQQNVQLVFRAGQVQDSVAVIIPDTLKARVVRQGRQYSVYWGDTFICTGPTKKKSRHAKNAFNAFLVSLQRMAVTEPDALVHQFQTYFDLATQDGNGFQPVMQDEFPEE